MLHGFTNMGDRPENKNIPLGPFSEQEHRDFSITLAGLRVFSFLLLQILTTVTKFTNYSEHFFLYILHRADSYTLRTLDSVCICWSALTVPRTLYVNRKHLEPVAALSCTSLSKGNLLIEECNIDKAQILWWELTNSSSYMCNSVGFNTYWIVPCQMPYTWKLYVETLLTSLLVKVVWWCLG
jgi:hypothetical protein